MAGKAKRGLGRGLNTLFGDLNENEVKDAEKNTSSKAAAEKDRAERPEAKKDNGEMLKLSEILVNTNQPRKNFDAEKQQELTESVRQYGILQPLLVQKEEKGYRIIAGERRYRAAKEAGLKEVPVIIRSYSSQQAAEISIIENVQRADLNPMEEAMAYQMLIDDYSLTQEEIASRVSKNRTTITNALRLLKLSPKVQELVAAGQLSAGHARTLIGIEDREMQEKTADMIVEKGISVRETENLVRQTGKKASRKEKTEPANDVTLFYQDYEDRMRNILGTKVHINRRDKNKGRIEIDYYSASELERIMELLRSIRQ